MRKVGTDKSGVWIGEAFGLVRAHPAPFLMMALFYTLIAQIPFFGVLIILFLGPALVGGMVYAANLASSGQAPQVGHVFRVFQAGDRVGSYVALCLPLFMFALVMIALLLPLLPAIVSTLRTITAGGHAPVDMDQVMHDVAPLISSHMGAISLWMLAYLALAFVTSMVTFLAPARIMFAKVGAFTAMRDSFNACRTNLAAYLLLRILLTLIMLGMMFVATVLSQFLPDTLSSILALTPFNALVTLVVYVMYRSIFGVDPAGTAVDGEAVPPPAPASSHTLEA